MFGSYFYNETTKRAVSIFGTMFNNITIKEVKTDGTVINVQKVPISYGPKKRWLARLQQDPKARDGNVSAISLPRMSFEISGIEYDSTRQQNKLIRNNKSLTGSTTQRNYQYMPAPYNLSFDLSIVSNNVTEALQIVEQILPYFQPEYTVAMKMIDSMEDTRDVPIVLNNVSYEDNYEESFDSRRIVQYTLNFTMKLYFFGPVTSGKVITKVIERDYINTDVSGTFTTTQIDGSGLVKEVKSYEPVFTESFDAATNTNEIRTVSIPSTNLGPQVGDRVFNTNLETPPTISSIIIENNAQTGFVDARVGYILSENVTIEQGTVLEFAGSVSTEDTYIISENVTFYDDGTDSTYSEDIVSDNS